MELHLSRLHFPITTLGPGTRVGVWFQGCSLRCAGCVSADTWAHGPGQTTVEAVLGALGPWLAAADGVTVSGGEPLEQKEALRQLLLGIRQITGAETDVLLYSGRTWEALRPDLPALEGLVDVLISDPYDAAAGQTLAWRGSDNQRMHLLTPLGRLRYAGWVKAPRTALPRALDVFADETTVWMAGIPQPGSLEAVQAALREAGFESDTTAASPRGKTPPAFFA